MRTSLLTLLLIGIHVFGGSSASAACYSDSLVLKTFPADTILKIEANSEKGFNFPYYLRIPKGLNPADVQHLLVETNNTGQHDSLAFHVSETYLQIKKNSLGASLCRNLKIPFLMPVFPRPKTAWSLYTHALDRDAALLDTGSMQRLDLQLMAMIEHARSVLSTFEIKIKQKVVMNGFSASGTFANRFTLLHPEMVAGVACGGINALAILPLEKLDGKKLNYPLGINDIESVFGLGFNLEKYIKVPQYLYMGEKDNNDAVRFDDAYSKAERKTVFKVIGEVMLPDRFMHCKEIYASVHANSTFTIYPNIGHETEQTVFMDVYTFFKTVMVSDE